MSGRWRYWRLTHWLVQQAASLGILRGWWLQTDYTGTRVLNLRHYLSWGHRSYVLGWPDWKWRCLLRQRHWPGEFIGLGCCGKCAPHPCCGAVTYDHAEGCVEDPWRVTA